MRNRPLHERLTFDRVSYVLGALPDAVVELAAERTSKFRVPRASVQVEQLTRLMTSSKAPVSQW